MILLYGAKRFFFRVLQLVEYLDEEDTAKKANDALIIPDSEDEEYLESAGSGEQDEDVEVNSVAVEHDRIWPLFKDYGKISCKLDYFNLLSDAIISQLFLLCKICFQEKMRRSLEEVKVSRSLIFLLNAMEEVKTQRHRV